MSLAAQAASDVALKIETMGRKGDLAGAERTYEALDEEIDSLKAALAALLQEANR